MLVSSANRSTPTTRLRRSAQNPPLGPKVPRRCVASSPPQEHEQIPSARHHTHYTNDTPTRLRANHEHLRAKTNKFSGNSSYSSRIRPATSDNGEQVVSNPKSGSLRECGLESHLRHGAKPSRMASLAKLPAPTIPAWRERFHKPPIAAFSRPVFGRIGKAWCPRWGKGKGRVWTPG